MKTSTFEHVWYLPEENRWRDMKMLAMRDVGTLVVNAGMLQYAGKKEKVFIKDIKRISCGKQGRDFVNDWIKIEYENGKMAFFADGSMLGWGGIFGGTAKIMDVIVDLNSNVK